MHADQDKIDVRTLKAEHGTRFVSLDEIRRAEGGWFQVGLNAWSRRSFVPQDHPVGIRAVATRRATDGPPSHPHPYELDLAGTPAGWSPRLHTWRPNLTWVRAEVVAHGPL